MRLAGAALRLLAIIDGALEVIEEMSFVVETDDFTALNRAQQTEASRA